MPDTFTPTLNLTKVGINESDDTWGTKLNANCDKIDAGIAADRADITALETRLAAAEAEALRASFIGEIRIYSGLLADIPNIGGTGSNTWRICDGTNGTPNLINKFVMGAGGTTAQGAAGGAASWTGKVVSKTLSGLKAVGRVLTLGQMPRHGHVASGQTDDQGDHEHGLPGAWSNGGLPGSYPVGNQLYVGGQHHENGNTARGGTHRHNLSISVAEAGSSEAHDHDLPNLSHDHDATVPTLPPYLAYAFIRRMK